MTAHKQNISIEPSGTYGERLGGTDDRTKDPRRGESRQSIRSTNALYDEDTKQHDEWGEFLHQPRSRGLNGPWRY